MASWMASSSAAGGGVMRGIMRGVLLVLKRGAERSGHHDAQGARHDLALHRQLAGHFSVGLDEHFWRLPPPSSMRALSVRKYSTLGCLMWALMSAAVQYQTVLTNDLSLSTQTSSRPSRMSASGVMPNAPP